MMDAICITPIFYLLTVDSHRVRTLATRYDRSTALCSAGCKTGRTADRRVRSWMDPARVQAGQPALRQTLSLRYDRSTALIRLVLLGLVFLLVAGVSSAQEPLERGLDLRASGLYGDAISLFEELVAETEDPEIRLLLAETLAWNEQFDDAELVYRELVAEDRSPGAVRGLAQLLQWRGNYDEAIRLYETLLRAEPDDLDLLESLARTHYWSGDFRRASVLFDRLLASDSDRSEAAADLDAIRSASRPLLTARASSRTDDQPLERNFGSLSAIVFSDPLTKWIFEIGGADLRGRDRSGSASWVSVETVAELPRLRLTLGGAIRPVRFPDGETRWLGGISVDRAIGRSKVSLFHERNELLWTTSAIDRHPWMARSGLSWGFDSGDGRVARIDLASLSFSDDNDGRFASAYLLTPLRSRSAGLNVLAGVSGLYRDTDESRFRLTGVESRPREPAGFDYDYRGVYDPYWSPHDLREARLLLTVHRSEDWFDWRIDATAGIAEEEAPGFGPQSGSFPFPGSPFVVTYSRRFEPWSARASIEREWEGFVLQISYERSVTAEYDAEEIGAALVRRF